MKTVALCILLAIFFTMGLIMGAGLARADEPHFRVTMAVDILHAQGFSSPSIRYGNEWGVRVGQFSEPIWMDDINPRARALHKNFNLDSTMFYGIDYERCFTKWCASLGLAHVAETSKINGTHWNFMLGARYVIDKNWSLDYLHFSHGSALGIKEDKSNNGWNFLGVGYSFR